jgi:hypothetical protein
MAGWKHLGASVDADLFELRDDVLIVVPFADTRQTEDVARANLAGQRAHWDAKGHGGAVIIFMDPVLEQTAGARAVYANEAGESGSLCFALIGESYFAMAASAVYTGLARPSVPLQVFRNFEDALPWVDEILEQTKK